MASYKDIQQRTGLSLATISKHFNGGAVRPENARMIQEAAKDLGFRINDMARSLRRGSSRTVGILLPVLDNPFILAIIDGVERRLQAGGVGVLICSSHPSGRADGGAVEALRAKTVDGILAVPSPHDLEGLSDAQDAGIPVVTVDHDLDGLECDHVQLDNQTAGAMAAHHLIDHGHRRIAFIGGDEALSSLAERCRGFERALRSRGVAVEERWVSRSEISFEAGSRAMRDLLAQDERPSAVFAANYDLTIGALMTLNDFGLDIPADMSFLGFDVPDIARVTRPRVTTLVQPMRLIAEHAADLLLARLGDGAADAPRRMAVPVDLASGGSVGAPAPIPGS